MGKVTYGQSGYVGSSMSESACEAYKNDEKPKSKWTKTAMLAAISAWCKDNRRVMLPEVAKMLSAGPHGITPASTPLRQTCGHRQGMQGGMVGRMERCSRFCF